MKKFFIILLMLLILSCTNRFVPKIEEDLLSLEQKIEITNKKVDFLKDGLFEVDYFNFKEVSKKIIDKNMKEIDELKKYEKDSSDFKYKYEQVLNKIKREITEEYNNHLKSVKASNIVNAEKPEFIEWLKRISLLEIYDDDQSYDDYDKIIAMDYIINEKRKIEEINTGEVFKSYVNTPIPFTLDKKSNIFLTAFTDPKVYLKNVKWGSSTYSGAYIVGKLVNDTSRYVSGKIEFPIYDYNTKDFLKYGREYFNNIPPKTTYSFKLLVIFDGTVTFYEPKLEYRVED